MMDQILLVLFIILFCTIWLIHIVRRKQDPPGPLGIPVFGIMFSQMYHSATNKCHRFFFFLKKSGEKYGDVWSFEVGMQKFVVLHSYKAIRKAMFESGDIFSGRPNSELHLQLSERVGIISTEGNLWRIHRRFTLSKLKTFGLGKQSMEPNVITECEFIKDLILKNIKKPVNSADILVKGIANVISVLVFGERWAYDDSKFLEYVSHAQALTHASGISAFFPIFFPIFSKPWIMSKLPACAYLLSESQKLRNIITEKYLEQKNHFQPTDEPINLIEAYLQQQYFENSSKNTNDFNDEKCIGDCFDLFIAGMDTTTTNLSWALLMLAAYPGVQQKFHSEIDAVIGRAKNPQMIDRKLMPYCQATLDEVARFGTIAPHAVDKRVMEDTVFMGYRIPSSAQVLADIYSVHRSEELWDKPQVFNPERFLDINGEYKPSEYLSAFGLGKRRCLGEGLAQMENFLILISILQRFSVSLDDESMIRLNEIIIGNEGIIHSPGSHKIIFRTRD